jgi:acetyl/propionyl-CoA carboxylase alpha subunit
LTPALRDSLCAAGLAAARAAGYVNAGTVEFLLDAHGRFHFLEMNTRIQVEHPVTEAVTGLDLVRLQIEIAAGRPLPFGPGEITPRGHALECRLYAEDPQNDDLPSPGRVLHLSAPEGPGVRFDSALTVGTEVTVHYDPLLAKIVTWGRERGESIERMTAALRQTAVLGVVTNLARLRAIVEHPAFAGGELHTGFVEEHLGELSPAGCAPDEAVAAAAAALHVAARRAPARPLKPPEPWERLGPWRLGG